MATSSKRPLGIGLMGFAFAMVGVIFLVAGNTGLGGTMAAAGLVIFLAGLATARKAGADDHKAAELTGANGVHAEPTRART